LGPVIAVVCALGTFSVHASFIETYLMFGAGIVGFFMRLVLLVLLPLLGRMGAKTADASTAGP